jgi:hypothetical protein
MGRTIGLRYPRRLALQAALIAMPLALAFPATAQAHCEVGGRWGIIPINRASGDGTGCRRQALFAPASGEDPEH